MSRFPKLKPLRDLDSVGWGFFGIVFVIIIAPVSFAVWYYTLENVEWPVRVLAGVFLAAVCAAVIAFVVNDALFRRGRRRYEAERKAEKKARAHSGKKRKKKH